LVEGIDPKIEGLFHAIGIKNWRKLSETNYHTMKNEQNSTNGKMSILIGKYKP
jgi:hypothetical protein